MFIAELHLLSDFSACRSVHIDKLAQLTLQRIDHCLRHKALGVPFSTLGLMRKAPPLHQMQQICWHIGQPDVAAEIRTRYRTVSRGEAGHERRGGFQRVMPNRERQRHRGISPRRRAR